MLGAASCVAPSALAEGGVGSELTVGADAPAIPCAGQRKRSRLLLPHIPAFSRRTCIEDANVRRVWECSLEGHVA